jgi:hypothetical protein
MNMQVTNLLAVQLNYLDYYLGYPGVPGVTAAVGGNRVNPVPYPFDWYVFPANGTTGYNPTFPSHLGDLIWQKTPTFSPHKPYEAWNQLIQAGTVSVTVTTETGTREFFDYYDHLV